MQLGIETGKMSHQALLLALLKTRHRNKARCSGTLKNNQRVIKTAISQRKVQKKRFMKCKFQEGLVKGHPDLVEMSSRLYSLSNGRKVPRAQE